MYYIKVSYWRSSGYLDWDSPRALGHFINYSKKNLEEEKAKVMRIKKPLIIFSKDIIDKIMLIGKLENH